MSKRPKDDDLIIIEKEPWKIRSPHLPEKEFKDKKRYNRKKKHKKRWQQKMEEEN